jgi:hypothetical protein
MKLRLLILFLIVTAGAQAQIHHRIHQKNRIVTGIPIADIDSVTNTGNTNTIRLKNSSIRTFQINNIDSITHAVPVTNNLYNIVSNDAALTQFKKGVDLASLNPYPYALSGNMTVFAPNDQLINAFGIDMSEEDIRYHTLSERILTTDIPVGTKNLKKYTISTNNLPEPDSVFISRPSNITNAITVNGALISTTASDRNITASNGNLHKLALIAGPIGLDLYGYLFVPSKNTIYNDIIAGGGGIDSLKQAILLAESFDPTIKTILSSQIVTIIAPVDSAFRNILSTLNFPNINAWFTSNKPIFVQMIKDHILIDRQFALNILDVSTAGVSTISGAKVQMAQSAGRYGFQLQSGSLYAPLTSSSAIDFMFKNGVAHFTGRVMLRQ